MTLRLTIGTALLLTSVGTVLGQSLVPLPTFGGGDGWRAPNEILAGDTAGTASGGNYNYLQSSNLERGLAYNSTTGNLILVSRSTAGNGIRILSGTTGVDIGALNQGSGIISGGTFTTNMVGVGEDGAVYVANLQTNTTTGNFRVYRWADSAPTTTPTVAFSNTITGFTAGTPRVGDSLDVIGSGVNTQIVAGAQGVTGYARLTTTDGVNYTAAAISPAATGSLTAGDFRLGITFGPTTDDVWGKQTGQPLERISHAGGIGTYVGSTPLTSAGEAPIDFTTVTIGTTTFQLLAALDVNNSILRVYEVTNPAAPTLLASGTTTSGTLPGNANATGSVQFGAFDSTTNNIVIYAMSTNQGIQAFNFNPIPEPGSILALSAAVAAGAGWWNRRRRGVKVAGPQAG
jgi:hypothetical protein